MPGGGLLRVLAQVVPQVPAVGDLHRARGALAGAVGVGAGPVPADHGDARVSLEPVRQDVPVPARQQVDDLVRFHVHQHGGVVLPLAGGDVVGAQHRDRARRNDLGAHNAPHERGLAAAGRPE